VSTNVSLPNYIGEVDIGCDEYSGTSASEQKLFLCFKLTSRYEICIIATHFVSLIRPPNIGKNRKKIKQRAFGYLLLAMNPSSHNFSSDLVSGRALSPSNARDLPSLLYRQFTVTSAPPMFPTPASWTIHANQD